MLEKRAAVGQIDKTDAGVMTNMSVRGRVCMADAYNERENYRFRVVEPPFQSNSDAGFRARTLQFAPHAHTSVTAGYAGASVAQHPRTDCAATVT
jgi:hypothetical protein